MRFLLTVSGKDLGDTVRRMMRMLMTNQLMGHYSLKGKNGKKSFSAMPVCSVLERKYIWMFVNIFKMAPLI